MNLWLIYSLLTVIFVTTYNLYVKKVLSKPTDILAFTSLTDIVAGLVLLPIIFVEGVKYLPFPYLILILIGASLIAVSIDLLMMKGRQLVDASVAPIAFQFGTVCTVIAAIILFKESFTALKLIGVTLIIIGNTLLFLKKKLSIGKGILYIILGSVLFAAITLINKYLMAYISPALLQVIWMFAGGLWIFLLIRLDTGRLAKEIAQKKGSLFIVGFILGAQMLTFLKAIQLGEASRVAPIVQLNLLLSVIFGILLLKEREHLWKKLLAGLLVFAGVILVSI